MATPDASSSSSDDDDNINIRKTRSQVEKDRNEIEKNKQKNVNRQKRRRVENSNKVGMDLPNSPKQNGRMTSEKGKDKIKMSDERVVKPGGGRSGRMSEPMLTSLAPLPVKYKGMLVSEPCAVTFGVTPVAPPVT